jgi:hypothetical protein
MQAPMIFPEIWLMPDVGTEQYENEAGGLL